MTIINVGVESYHPDGLASLNKLYDFEEPITTTRIEQALTGIKEAGIIPSANLIIFYPDVEWSHIYETVKGAVDLMKIGGETNMTTYVHVYHGADILKDETIPRSTYAEPILAPVLPTTLQTFWHDTVLLPRNLRMRTLAEKAIIKRSQLEENYKRKYGWSHTRAPHPIVQLCFNQALIEEGINMGFIDQNSAQPLLDNIKQLVNREFNERGVTSLPHSKRQVDGIPISITPDLQIKARELKSQLIDANIDSELVGQLSKLRTSLLCDIWDEPVCQAVKPYLEYLFFAEEKSRFSHMDSLDKFIVVHGMLDRLALQPTQEQAVLEAYAISRPSEEDLTKFRDKIDIYIKDGIWKGPDNQSVISDKIRKLLFETFGVTY